MAAVADTWRDLYFAQRIASGAEWPLVGPVIGNLGHLGPLWYYTIGAAFALGGAPAVLWTTGLLSGLKFPLGFLLGRRLGGTWAGGLFALALAVPGWSMFELLWPTHTSLVASTLLGLGLMTLAYRQQPSLARATGLGACAMLALHAHPTTLLLAALALIFGVQATAVWPQRLRDGALAGVVMLLPLLPHWIQQAIAVDASELSRLSGYVGGELQIDVVDRLGPLLLGLFWGGPEMLLRLWLAAGAWAEALLILYLLGLALAAFGGCANVAIRTRFLALLAVLLAHSVFVLMLRPYTPFWMAHAHAPLIAGWLALGWFGLWQRWRWLRLPLVAVLLSAAIAPVLLLRLAITAPEVVDYPVYPSSGAGLMDVASVREGSTPMRATRLPLRNMAPLGATLCAPTVAYGHLASWLDESFGVGPRQACGGIAQILLGGPPVPGHALLAGLSEPAARAGGMSATTSGLWLGKVDAVWSAGQAQAIVNGGRFPPRDPLDLPASRTTLQGNTSAGALLMVAARTGDRRPFVAPHVLAAGHPVTPIFQDAYLLMYRCVGCGQGEVAWSLHFEALSPFIDVLVLDPQPREH
ncbi:MAG: hypothetical protein ACT4NL_03045 [Pseudomarimonas sp.]